MERTGWVAAAIMAAGIMVAGFFVGNMHLKSKKFERSVEVKGLAEREVKADLAVWPIQISLTGNELTKLQNELEGQKEEVRKFFLGQGFKSEEIIMGATNIQDGKADIYRTQYLEYRYIAKTDITIRTSAIDRLQQALSESLQLVAKGILVVSRDTWRPIEYTYTQLNSIKPAMVEEATKNAREVAEKFALDSGSKVGKIKSARQGLFSISDMDASTPEIKNVRVVTTVEYFLQD
jgi:hypothetical protein